MSHVAEAPKSSKIPTAISADSSPTPLAYDRVFGMFSDIGHLRISGGNVINVNKSKVFIILEN